MNNTENIGDILLSLAKQYGGTFLYCLCFALGGWILSVVLCKLIRRALNKSKKLGDKAEKIITGLIKGVICVTVIIIVLNAFHVPITAIVALFSAIGLALSLAVKDTLSNFAKGFQLLLTHPFKTGDYIEVDGVTGTVKTIEIIYTRLATPDNKIILIPNSQIADGQIINYSSEENRRLDLSFSIENTTDIETIKSIISNVVCNHSMVLQSPSPIIRVGGYEKNTVNITVWVWVERDDYINLHFELNEQIQQALVDNGIEFPCFHQNINIYHQ